jgi:hypothetical protein
VLNIRRASVGSLDKPATISPLAKQPFWAIAFFKRFCQICHPVFTYLNFATIFYRARSSALRLTFNLEDQVSVYVPQRQGGLVIPPGLSVAFYDSQGYGGGILTCLHRRHLWLISDSLMRNLLLGLDALLDVRHARNRPLEKPPLFYCSRIKTGRKLLL